jgi:hypothetical protein
VVVGGVGDGETGSVSLYNVGNLNKLDVLIILVPRMILCSLAQLLSLI